MTVTCVMDCCHSGSVLELPYSFRPTDSDSGTIRMRRNVNSLSNLAFLYVLAGGHLPVGFDNVQQNIEDTTGGTLQDYQGTGVDESEGAINGDDYAADDVADGGDFDDAADAAEYGAIGDAADHGAAAERTDGGFGDTDGDAWNGDVGAGCGDEGAGVWDEDAGVWDGVEAVDGADMDCSCFADVLGGLLDQ